MIEFKKFLHEQYRDIPPSNEFGNYNFVSSVIPVPSFRVPEGMAAMGTDPNNLKHPDPTESRNQTLDYIVDRDLYDSLRKEWMLFGDSLYLNNATGKALERFQSTPSYRDLFQSGETRWGVRPPIINWLTGGVDDSYHKTGQAVDLKLKMSSRSITNQQLIDCVWNALWSGFRGIGFGGGQFHFDTRSGGMLGYTYDKYHSNDGPPIILKKAFLELAKQAKDVEDMATVKKYVEASQRVRTNDVLPKNTGRGSSTRHFSDSDINLYIDRQMDAAREGIGATISQTKDIGSALDSTSDSGTETLTFVNNPSSTTTSQPSKTKTTGGSITGGDLVSLGILGFVILGGFYGFRAFFRHIRDRSERARYEKDIRRLLSQRSRRELIGEFRMKHANAIVRAKRDPRLARELEFKLAKILADNGYPIY